MNELLAGLSSVLALERRPLQLRSLICLSLYDLEKLVRGRRRVPEASGVSFFPNFPRDEREQGVESGALITMEQRTQPPPPANGCRRRLRTLPAKGCQSVVPDLPSDRALCQNVVDRFTPLFAEVAFLACIQAVPEPSVACPVLSPERMRL